MWPPLVLSMPKFLPQVLSFLYTLLDFYNILYPNIYVVILSVLCFHGSNKSPEKLSLRTLSKENLTKLCYSPSLFVYIQTQHLFDLLSLFLSP